jgi:hypothetical protein
VVSTDGKRVNSVAEHILRELADSRGGPQGMPP